MTYFYDIEIANLVIDRLAARNTELRAAIARFFETGETKPLYEAYNREKAHDEKP